MNPFKINKILTLHVAGITALMAFLSLNVFAEKTANDTAEIPVVSDLATALTLQGVDCDEIDEYKQLDENSYEVNCESGRSFSILGTADGLINIVDNLTGKVWKGVGSLISKIPLTGSIFKTDKPITNHDAEIARSLFSIIELSGNECEAIENLKTIKSNEHIVTCINQQTYRIYNQENGYVKVDIVDNSVNGN